MKTFASDISEALIQRLKEKGIESQIVKRFIKDLIYAFGSHPEITPFELDSYLHRLGWNDVNLDYQTYQLAKACFEDSDLKNSMML